jgi:hypothetical protein
LGTANTIDSLIVKWPSGRTTILTNVAANQTLTVNEDNCNAVSTNCPTFPASLTQGLVGYWPFCGNANDESGNGNNGTVNGATLITDRFGNGGSAYSFDGVSNKISYSNKFIFNETSDGSVSIWIKNDTIKSNIYSTLIYSRLNNSAQNRFNIYLQPLASNSKIRLTSDYREPNGVLHILNTSNELINKSWCHLLISRLNNKYTFYINGIPADTANDLAPNLPTETGWILGNNGSNDLNFNGSLDDIAIWNRALTPQEITQLYNQGICQTSITVTDTLLIHTGITTYNPVAYGNTLKVWPNPGNQDITLDAGNLSSMQGWKYKVANTLGQTVVNETAINQQQTMIDLSNWGGNGIYYLHLINPQGHAIEIKKIVLAP